MWMINISELTAETCCHVNCVIFNISTSSKPEKLENKWFSIAWHLHRLSREFIIPSWCFHPICLLDAYNFDKCNHYSGNPITTTVLEHTQPPPGKPCLACGSYFTILKQRCSSSLWQRVKTETDGIFGSKGHLAASIQPDQSFTLFPLCPLTKRCPLKHWAVRGEVTLIAPLHLLSPTWVSSILAHHALSVFLFLSLIRPSPSFGDTLAYWSAWRRDHWLIHAATAIRPMHG